MVEVGNVEKRYSVLTTVNFDLYLFHSHNVHSLLLSAFLPNGFSPWFHVFYLFLLLLSIKQAGRNPICLFCLCFTLLDFTKSTAIVSVARPDDAHSAGLSPVLPSSPLTHSFIPAHCPST